MKRTPKYIKVGGKIYKKAEEYDRRIEAIEALFNYLQALPSSAETGEAALDALQFRPDLSPEDEDRFLSLVESAIDSARGLNNAIEALKILAARTL